MIPVPRVNTYRRLLLEDRHSFYPSGLLLPPALYAPINSSPTPLPIRSTSHAISNHTARTPTSGVRDDCLSMRL